MDELEQLELLRQQQAQAAPEDLLDQQRALGTRQKMAMMLMQQNQQPQGQMVSGQYVAPNWAQQLTPVVNQLAGAYLTKQAEDENSKIAKQLRQGKMAAEQNVMDAMSPTPAKVTELAGPYGQDVNKSGLDVSRPVAVQDAKGPDWAKALAATNNPYGAGKDLRATILKNMNPEDTADYKNFLKVKAEGFPGNFNDYQTMDANRKRPVSNTTNIVNTGQKGFTNTMDLNNAWKAEPIYKAHQEVKQAYNQVVNSLDRSDATGDLAAAIKINKLFDPTSVVRETEVATVANAKGGLDRLKSFTDKIISGETLTATQRKQYKELAKDFYDISGQQYNETRDRYSNMGKQYELKDADVLLGKPYNPASGNIKGWGQVQVSKP